MNHDQLAAFHLNLPFGTFVLCAATVSIRGINHETKIGMQGCWVVVLRWGERY